MLFCETAKRILKTLWTVILFGVLFLAFFKLYTVNKTRLGVDCGSDYELLLAKFRLKLKKVGKNIRYDLNQIPYDYIVELTNRFKGLGLIECLKKYGQRFMTLYRKW